MRKHLAGFVNRHGRLVRRMCMCASVLIAAAVLVTGCGCSKQQEVNADAPVGETSYQTIDTSYGPLRISAEGADKLRHTETVEDGVTKETFYMHLENGEKELFQICFGIMEEGDSIGWMVIDGKRLPVTVIVPAYDVSAFSEAERETYQSLMGNLDVLLSLIRKDERFTTQADVETFVEPDKQPVQLTYWDVVLPITMEWEEKETNNVYTVDFYGMIDAERIRLYTISLGDTPAESALGMYMVAGEARMLGITPYTLDSQLPDATDAQRQTYSVLMDTINTVLPVIMGSENYSPEIPE